MRHKKRFMAKNIYEKDFGSTLGIKSEVGRNKMK